MDTEEMTPREIAAALLEKLGTQVAVAKALFVHQGLVSRWLNGHDVGMSRRTRELARQALAQEK